MKVDKMSVSFDPELGEAIRVAAKRGGGSLSGWLADAAATKLRAESFAEFLAEYEAKHGAFTDEEMAEASRDLGLPWPPLATKTETGVTTDAAA